MQDPLPVVEALPAGCAGRHLVGRNVPGVDLVVRSDGLVGLDVANCTLVTLVPTNT